MAKRKSTSSLSLPGVLLGGTLAAAGGWLLYSALGVNHQLPLPPAIPAEQRRFVSKTARFLSYYVDRSASGTPLVLIHSINAAASAYEMRPLFQQYRATRLVYALDLPGFGFSERANRVYTPQLYTEAIIDLIERQIGEPADVIALSLGSEFAARAALQRPDLIRSLALISPSGFTLKGDKPASQSASESPAKDAAYAVLAFPLWSQGFYDVLVTRKSIYSFLRQSFYGEVDVGLAEYDYLTAHQPGARYAPLFFVSGQLFSPDIYETVYRHLTQPVLVLHDQDAYVSFERLPELMQERPNWQAIRVAPTRGLPHFEQLAATTDALDGFWERVRV